MCVCVCVCVIICCQKRDAIKARHGPVNPNKAHRWKQEIRRKKERKKEREREVGVNQSFE